MTGIDHGLGKAELKSYGIERRVPTFGNGALEVAFT